MTITKGASLTYHESLYGAAACVLDAIETAVREGNEEQAEQALPLLEAVTDALFETSCKDLTDTAGFDRIDNLQIRAGHLLNKCRKMEAV